jgi:molybdopterin/thiamine biosynthesis adenylyltransferase
MSTGIEHDRLSHLVMKRDATEYDEARKRLDRAAFILTAGDCVRSAWGQAALLTIAECGVRMFPGGVYLGQPFEEPTIVGHRLRAPLHRHLEASGCRAENPPPHAERLHVGADAPIDHRGLRCWAEGWTAVVSPKATDKPATAANEIGGVLAGAMGVTELFRIAVFGDIRAGRRTQRLSALRPGAAEGPEPELHRLPASYWLLGLGNLGQAALWTISLLPYSDTGAVTLFLQDTDTAELGNLPIQILTKPGWIDVKKARAAAAWAEAFSFKTTIIERRFTDRTVRADGEPGLALVGVDNLPTRRAAADANFDLVIDAGLGASAVEVFDIRIHAFPGARTAAQAWPGENQQPSEHALGSALEKLVAEGRIDRCGALTIGGRGVGVPSTAVAAAALQVAQACRAVSESTYCDLIDTTLADCRRTFIHEFTLQREGSIPSLKREMSPNYLRG